MPKCKEFELDPARSDKIVCAAECLRCCFNCAKASKCMGMCPEYGEPFTCNVKEPNESCAGCRFQDTDKCPLKRRPKEVGGKTDAGQGQADV